jgi:hypothetical protein
MLEYINFAIVYPDGMSQEDLHIYNVWYSRYIHTMQWVMAWMVCTCLYILFKLKMTRGGNSVEK